MKKEILQGDHGSYELIKELGSGGFGVTWLARRLEDGLHVVVKKLHTSRLKDWKSMELFEREAMVLESLDHPNIPDYVDFMPLGESNAPEGLVLVQTFVEGDSLETVRSSPRTLSPVQMLAWLERVLEILDYLHTRTPPVIHRDISPKNIMLAPNGQPHLIDFGTVQAKIASETDVGSTSAGTFGYSPHEQFVGRAGPTSDLYSLAATFLAVATGRGPDQLPYRDSRFAVRESLAGHDYEKRVLDVLHDMTEPNASDRPSSAAEVLRRLRESPEPPVATTPQRSGGKSGNGKSLLLGLILAVVAFGVGIAIFLGVQDLQPAGPDNPTEFDLQAYIPEAQEHVREAFTDDAELIAVSWSQVPRSGIVDLTREDSGSQIYYFRSPSRTRQYRDAIEKSPRTDPEIHCKGQTVVNADYVIANELEDSSHCAELMDATPPTCTLQQVWEKAIVMGAPLEEVGRGDFWIDHLEDQALGRQIPVWRVKVADGYYEVYDQCGDAARITASEPPDYSSFDLIRFSPTALQMAQERYPGLDLLLVSLNGDGVYPNGKADLTLNDDFDVIYVFMARLPPKDDGLPIGASEDIKDPCLHVRVRVANNVARVSAGSVRECETPPPPITCSVEEVWQKAIADGAPAENAVAEIRLKRSDSDRWYVKIGSLYSKYLPDDC